MWENAPIESLCPHNSLMNSRIVFVDGAERLEKLPRPCNGQGLDPSVRKLMANLSQRQ
jgi:hypothetical protein